MTSQSDLPDLLGTSDLQTSPSKPSSDRKSTGQRKSGKRISELQKRFASSTNEAKTVDANAVASPMSRSATAQKIYEHEVKVWLEKQVVASRDF